MDKKRIFFFIGLILMFLSLSIFSNFGTFEDASWTKLWVLVAMILSASIGLAFVFNPQQIWLNTCRYFSGILFVFSGFVKEFINMEVDNALNDGEYGREYGAQ